MGYRDLCFRFYFSVQPLMAPGVRYSQELYEEELFEIVDSDTEWLDLGCGHRILPSWRFDQELQLVGRAKKVIGIDADAPSVLRHRSIPQCIVGNIEKLPFGDASFDLVTANMVVEHLDAPHAQFQEVYRVLRPGGRFIFHTVNDRGYYVLLANLIPPSMRKKVVWMFERRAAEDVFPTHYLANSEETIERIGREVGFSETRVNLVTSSAKFIVIPPFVLIELIWLRLLQSRKFRQLRPNIIAILTKV